MKKMRTVRTFATGFLAALLLVGIVSSAVAATASKNITIYPGITVYIDEKKLEPKDANGNPVEVFTANGTTYLPVRAICEALGKEVVWDGSTKSVYVGKHTTGTTLAGYLCDTKAFYGSSVDGMLDRGDSKWAKDNLGNTHTKCFFSSFDNTYLLDGEYSHISGTIYLPYENRAQALNYSEPALTIYGDGEVLYTYSVERGVKGFRPVDFSVSLEGVTEARVVFTSGGAQGLWLGDTAFWK